MKKMTLENIHEWPLMTRLLLLGLIFAVVFFMGYRFDLAEQAKKLIRATAVETELKQQLEVVIARNKEIEAEVDRLPALKADLVKWDKQVVPYENIPQLLNDILKVGGDNHLYFSSFVPAASVPVENLPYSKVPIKAVVVGSYHEIADFMSVLANMNWIVVVGNFKISSSNEAVVLGDKLAAQAKLQHLLSAEINLEIYHVPEAKTNDQQQ